MANTYATVAGMVSAYGDDLLDVLDVEPGTEVSGNSTLLEAIDSANTMVDAYLRKRYALPLANVPHFLVQAAQRIAWFALTGEHRTPTFSETDEKLYREAMKLLESLASGDMELDPGTEDPSESVVLPAVVTLGSAIPQSQREGASNKPWFRYF